MAASRSFRVGALCVLWLLAACIALLHSALQYTVLSSKSSSPAPRTLDASVHGQRSDTSMKHHLQDQIGEDCFSAPPQPSAFDFISSKLPMFAASMVGIALCVFGAAGPSHASVSRMPMPRMPAHVSQQKMNVGAQALAAATVGALFSTSASRSPEDDELALPVLAHSGRTMQDVTAWQPRIIRPEMSSASTSSKNVPLSPTPTTAPVLPRAVTAFSGSYANSLPWESTMTALAAKTQSSGKIASNHPDASIPEVRSTSRGDVRDRDLRPTPGMTPSAISAPSVWAGVVNASTMGDQQQSFIDQWKEQQERSPRSRRSAPAFQGMEKEDKKWRAAVPRRMNLEASEKSNSPLIIGDTYESRDSDGNWRIVKVQSKNYDGSYTCRTMDASWYDQGVLWSSVQASQCREIQPSKEELTLRESAHAMMFDGVNATG